MNKREKVRLGNLISVKGGYSYKGEHIGKGSSLLLGMGCVSFNETFLESGARLYSGDAPDSFLATPGDIVLATRQQSDNLPILGAPAMIPISLKDRKVIIGTNLYQIENRSQISNQFLFWVLKNADYRNHIDSCSKGSTVKMITKDAVETYEFYCPPEKERNFIADILWTINNKIELLNRQNETLEKIAETVFRDLFVETAKDEWKTYPLKEIVNLKQGKYIIAEKVSDKVSGDYLYPLYGGNGIRGYLSTYDYETQKVAITCRGNGCGLIQLLEPYSTVSNSCIVFENDELVSTWFLYYCSKLLDFVSVTSGSAQPQITITDIGKLEIQLPDKSSLKKFDKSATLIQNKITSNRKQIQTLKALQNTLLPKLLSGELNLLI